MDIERLNNLKLQQHNMMAYSQVRSDFVKLIDAEIARQSATSEKVAEAIELFDGVIKYRKDQEEEVKKYYGGKLTDFYLDLNRKEALAITALQAYQPWVSVSERLPDDGIPVLVTYIGFNDGKLYSDGVAKWSIEENGYNGGWLWELDESEAFVEITHWKPLPQPPKGE